MALPKRIHSDLEILSISNITTNMDICNAKNGKIEVLNYDRESFSIILSKPVGVGMLVNIKARISIEQNVFDFNATGKIENVLQNPDKTHYLVVGLNQYNADQWTSFLDAKNSERKRVEHLFNSMKGEDA